jgi:ribosome-associated protein
MLSITPEIEIDEKEIHETFIRASGPGGQNVNKVASAVQLQFDVWHSTSLPQPVRDRLMRLAANRISTDGMLTIQARRFRTQEQNREDARGRLVALVQKALEPPKPRRATKPTRAARERRLEGKRHTGQVKKLRRPAPLHDS